MEKERKKRREKAEEAKLWNERAKIWRNEEQKKDYDWQRRKNNDRREDKHGQRMAHFNIFSVLEIEKNKTILWERC